jgi:antitoxin component YwqK of YwqJK toxin-antitoxin module
MDDFMSMQFRGRYFKGKKEGVWISHDPNTQKIRYLIEFYNDKRNGLYLEFNPNGIIIKEEYLKKILNMENHENMTYGI